MIFKVTLDGDKHSNFFVFLGLHPDRTSFWFDHLLFPAPAICFNNLKVLVHIWKFCYITKIKMFPPKLSQCGQKRVNSLIKSECTFFGERTSACPVGGGGGADGAGR